MKEGRLSLAAAALRIFSKVLSALVVARGQAVGNLTLT